MADESEPLQAPKPQRGFWQIQFGTFCICFVLTSILLAAVVNVHTVMNDWTSTTALLILVISFAFVAWRCIETPAGK